MISIGQYDLEEKEVNERWKDSAESFREDLRNDTYVDNNGVIRWESSDSIVPPSVFRHAWVEVPDTQVEAREDELDRLLNESKKSSGRTAEQMYERRAAFGEGKTVTNVLTGETYET